MKTKLILSMVVVALFLALILTVVRLQKEKKENKNTKELLKQSNQQIEYRNDSSTARVITDEASLKNMKILLNEYSDQLKDLGIKLKNVESLLKVAYKSSGTVTNQIVTNYMVRDSVNMTYDTVRSWSFNDGFLSMNCTGVNNSVTCPYTYSDTLTAVVHISPFKLFRPSTWRAKNRISNTDITFANPSTRAVQIKSIVKKRR
jgi:type II secretory pathway pseudopilin PulG